MALAAVIIAVSAATSSILYTQVAAVPNRTQVHIYTPFRADGNLIAGLKLQQVSAECIPDAENPRSVSRMNTYTCRLPRNADERHPFGPKGAAYICRGTCTTNPCWRIPDSKPLKMVCPIGAPVGMVVGFNGELVRVTNHPPQSVGIRNPLASQPWSYTMTNGLTCNAGAAEVSRPKHHPPLLDYLCGQGSEPLFMGKSFDRSKPLWTIGVASSAADAKSGRYTQRIGIAEAWFIGNGPT